MFILGMLEILVIVVVAMVVIGAITLLANSKTRIVGLLGLGIAGVMAACVVMLGMFVFLLKPSSVDSEYHDSAPMKTVHVEVTKTSTAPELEADSSSDETSKTEIAKVDPDEASDDLTPVDSTDEIKIKKLFPQDNRPSWVEAEPEYEADDPWAAVSSGPDETLPLCRKAVKANLVAETEKYINYYLATPDASQWVTVDLAYVERNLLSDKFEEEGEFGILGPMYQVHQRLEFNKDFQTHLENEWRRVKVNSRLLHTGVTTAGVLAVLGALFGFLRLDTATAGGCRGRLKLAAIVTILAVFATGVMLGRIMPWM